MFTLKVLHFSNPFLAGYLHFLYALKTIAMISTLLMFRTHIRTQKHAHAHTHTPKHTHLNTQILLSAHGTFFHCLSLFPGFSSQSNPHSEDLFLILRNTYSILYRYCYFSEEHHKMIDTTASKSFICSSVYIGTAKISYSKRDIFHSAP